MRGHLAIVEAGRQAAGTVTQPPKPRSALRVGEADRHDRTLAVSLLAMTLPWLAYTRLYFWLQPHHLTVDGPFMYVTGKPDPACGLTRTFAWLWRGDVLHALAVYPIGPIVAAGTVAAVIWAAAVLVLGRAVRLDLSPRQWRAMAIAALVVVGLNWTAKLVWLGM